VYREAGFVEEGAVRESRHMRPGSIVDPDVNTEGDHQ
jgi:hypothetical protein